MKEKTLCYVCCDLLGCESLCAEQCSAPWLLCSAGCMACRGTVLCGSCQPFSCSVSAWTVLMARSLVKHCCVLTECGQRSEEWRCGRAQKLPLYREALSWTERVVGWEEQGNLWVAVLLQMSLFMPKELKEREKKIQVRLNLDWKDWMLMPHVWSVHSLIWVHNLFPFWGSKNNVGALQVFMAMLLQQRACEQGTFQEGWGVRVDVGIHPQNQP